MCCPWLLSLCSREHFLLRVGGKYEDCRLSLPGKLHCQHLLNSFCPQMGFGLLPLLNMQCPLSKKEEIREKEKKESQVLKTKCVQEILFSGGCKWSYGIVKLLKNQSTINTHQCYCFSLLSLPHRTDNCTRSMLFSLFLLFPGHPFLPVKVTQAFLQPQSKLNWVSV